MYRSPSQSSLVKGKFFVFLATLCVFAITLFLARNLILVKSVDIALQSMFPKSKTHKIVYEKAYWEGGHIVISGLHLCEDDLDVVIDQLQMDFHFSIKNLFFEPHLKLTHPQIRILTTQPSENHSANMLGAFVPTDHFCLKADVQSGVLQVNDKRLYFSFVSKKEKEALGTLYVTHDPSLIKDSYLVAEFQVMNQNLNCALTVQQMELERIVQLLALVQPQLIREWESVQGQTQLKGIASLNFSGEIEELSCQFSIQNLAVSNPTKKLAASARSFEGNIHYPIENPECSLPWKRMASLMHLEKGEIHFLDTWNLVGLEGKLVLDPKEDPLLELIGNLEGCNCPLKFKLEGKGALHEDDSFWVELAMRLFDNKEKEAAFHLSVCRPEKQSFVIQSEFQEMFGAQLDFFRTFFTTAFPELEKWKILEGNFHGKCLARIEKAELSGLEIEYFEGKQIVLSEGEKSLPVDKLKLEGRFSQIFPKANGELSLEVSFPSSQWVQFFAPNAETLKTTKSSHLISNMKWKKGASKITGSFIANQEQDLLQFGFESAQFFPKTLEDVKEGWLHSASLSPVIYQPLLKEFSTKLNLQGELDIYGTFDGKELQLSIQSNGLRAAFPSFTIDSGAIGEKDPTFMKTEGRAKIKYDLETGNFEAKVPLKESKAYDKEGQFALQNVSGDLLISIDSTQRKIHGKFEQAELNLAAEPLFKEMKFVLNIDAQTDEVLFEEIAGKVAYATKIPCYFSSPYLHLKDENSIFEAKITQNGKELMLISALAPKSALEWKAHLKLSKEMPIQGTFEALLFSDPSKSYLSVDTYGQNLSFWGSPIENFVLSLKKQQNQWVIDTLKADALNFRGKGIYENQQLHATQFDLSFKDIALQGSGSAKLVSNEGGDWQVQAEMGFDLATHVPCPLQLHFHPGMKLAFSPSSGLMVSDIHFTGENSECAIEYLEYFPKSQKLKAQSCRALIAPELYESLNAAKALPASLQTVQLNEPIKAIFNLNVEKENLQLIGKVFQSFYWTEKKQDLLFNFERANRKGKLVLQEASREERVHLDLNFSPEGDVSIEKINGALGGISAHLKRDEGKKGLLAYTGEMKIDFSELKVFLPKDIQDTIENWKMGNGYQLLGQFVIPPNGYKEAKFFGKICGEEFEVLGLKLKKLETKAILSAKEAIFENLVLKDDAGNLSAKKMHWSKEYGDEWAFSIPLLSVQEMSPHLITKKPNKNLFIKQAIVTNLSGRLNDLSTFQGQGSFHFASRSKKDFSLFEVPIEMIKNLGLDPGLLTPTSGEIDFEFQQGKCVITKLKNVRSEGGRSEFYLPPAPMTSYLDLNGNVYVDLKMKQNVVLNLTEPFTLSIRGTFKEPRYSLR